MTLVELKQSTVSDMGNKRKCEDSDLYPASKCRMKKNKDSYVCRICDDQFDTIEELSTHRFSGNEGKKYKCNYCAKCYEQLSSKVELFHHLKTVHNGKKHYCLYCNLKFSLKDTLENHIDNEHKENIQSISPKSDSDLPNHARIDNLREHSSSVQEENKLKKVAS